MKIGYIFGADSYTNYLQSVDSIENLDKPLLIVGWKNAKKLYPKVFNVNKAFITENVYWTVNSSRDRLEYNESLNNFINACVDFTVSKYEYKYYDLLLEPYGLLDFSSFESYLLRGDIIYIKVIKRILGVSLELSNNLGYDIFSDLLKYNISPLKMLDEFSQFDNYTPLCF